MSTPIDRAAKALSQSTAHVAGRAFGVPPEEYENHAEAVTRATFESIDTDELADVIAQFWADTDTPQDAALAVKNYLTGETP